MKKIKFDNNGFTMVELLVVIILILLIFLIGGYSVFNVISKSKLEKYALNISNVEDISVDYANEVDIFWIDKSEVDYYYQCVSIQNLIDKGFFDVSVLDKEISDGVKINKNDRILLFKDKKNKVIISSDYLLDSDDKSLCDAIAYDVVGNGNINFILTKKSDNSLEVNIKWNLFNVSKDALKKYVYGYEVVGKNKEFYDNFDSFGESENISLNETVTVRAVIKKEDKVIALKEEELDEDIKKDEIGPNLDILPFVEYINNNSNDKDIYISAYDNESGLKVGQYTINYLFTDKKINTCNDIVQNVDSLKTNLVIENGNEFGDNKVKITIPEINLNSPGNIKLYACSVDLEDNAGNLYKGYVFDELKVYDLEKTVTTALFYLPSMLECSNSECSLGSGSSFFANYVSLNSGTNFYYLWSQPINVFKTFGMKTKFVGVYVAVSDIRNLFQNANDERYLKALEDAKVIFDNVTGEKYVFGYIPLSNMGMCLTTINCK